MTYRSVQPNEQDQRKQNEVIRQVMDGKTNNTGTVTLTASVASTAVIDARCGGNSVVLFSPTTSNASLEVAAGTIFVSSYGKKTFTITHANNSQSDRTFKYVIVG